LPRLEGVSCARNFAFGAQIRLARICQVERAAEALDQRHRAARWRGQRPSEPPAILRSHDARSPAPGRWFRACWRTGSATTPGHSAPIAAPAASQTPLPRGDAHSRPCGVRRSWGRSRASCRRTSAVVTPGFLPYALRASLRLFKFVADEFVGMAVLAHHAQEAVVEHAAAQERLELLAHILGQRSVLRRKTRNQIRAVRLYQRYSSVRSGACRA